MKIWSLSSFGNNAVVIDKLAAALRSNGEDCHNAEPLKAVEADGFAS